VVKNQGFWEKAVSEGVQEKNPDTHRIVIFSHISVLVGWCTQVDEGWLLVPFMQED